MVNQTTPLRRRKCQSSAVYYDMAYSCISHLSVQSEHFGPNTNWTVDLFPPTFSTLSVLPLLNLLKANQI